MKLYTYIRHLAARIDAEPPATVDLCLREVMADLQATGILGYHMAEQIELLWGQVVSDVGIGSSPRVKIVTDNLREVAADIEEKLPDQEVP